MGPNVTAAPHNGAEGGAGVNVAVGGTVAVKVGVIDGVLVFVNVSVGFGVFVGPGVLVRVGTFVFVGGPGEYVDVGSTKRVFVTGMVEVGVGDNVRVGTMDAVAVI